MFQNPGTDRQRGNRMFREKAGTEESEDPIKKERNQAL